MAFEGKEGVKMTWVWAWATRGIELPLMEVDGQVQGMIRVSYWTRTDIGWTYVLPTH